MRCSAVAGVVGLLALADACCVALARRAVEVYQRFMARAPLNGGNLPKAEEWLVLPVPALGIRDAGSVLRALVSLSVWPFRAGLLTRVLGFWLYSAPPPGSATGAKSTSSNKPIPATQVCSALKSRPAQTGGSAPTGTQFGPRTMQPGRAGQFGQPLQPGQLPTSGAAPQNAVPPQSGTPVQTGAPPQSPGSAPVSPDGAPPALLASPVPTSPEVPAVPVGTPFAK